MAFILSLTYDQIKRLHVVDAKSVPQGTDAVMVLPEAFETRYGTLSTTLSPGRRVTVSHRYGYLAEERNGARVNAKSTGTRSTQAMWLAPERGEVSVGDQIIIVTGYQTGTETAVTGVTRNENQAVAAVTTRYGTHRSWLKTDGSGPTPEADAELRKFFGLDTGPAAEISPEDMAISQWWIDRIISQARAAKRRHGYCDAIDKIVSELLAPVAPKWSVRPEDGGFAVYSPSDEKYSWYREESRANAEKKTKDAKAFKL